VKSAWWRQVLNYDLFLRHSGIRAVVLNDIVKAENPSASILYDFGLTLKDTIRSAFENFLNKNNAPLIYRPRVKIGLDGYFVKTKEQKT
jgi:hypothetical protein